MQITHESKVIDKNLHLRKKTNKSRLTNLIISTQLASLLDIFISVTTTTFLINKIFFFFLVKMHIKVFKEILLVDNIFKMF